MLGPLAHERAVEDRPQVEVASALRGFLEAVMERRVEQVELMVGGVQIGEAVLRDAVPELADDVERAVGRFLRRAAKSRTNV